MAELQKLIEGARVLREDFRMRAKRCAGAHDRHGYQIEAAACGIRLKALLEAKRAVEADK